MSSPGYLHSAQHGSTIPNAVPHGAQNGLFSSVQGGDGQRFVNPLELTNTQSMNPALFASHIQDHPHDSSGVPLGMSNIWNEDHLSETLSPNHQNPQQQAHSQLRYPNSGTIGSAADAVPAPSLIAGYRGSVLPQTESSGMFAPAVSSTSLDDGAAWNGAFPPIRLESNLPAWALPLVRIAYEAQHPATVILREESPVLSFADYYSFLAAQSQALHKEPTPAPTPPRSELNLSEGLRACRSIRVRRDRGVERTLPSTPGSYRCTLRPECSKAFTKKGDWKRHEKTHFPQTIWACSKPECASKRSSGREFCRKYRFMRHYNTFHGNGSQITSVEADQFRRQVHDSEWPRNCPYCSRDGFGSFDERLEHIAREHFENATVSSSDINSENNDDYQDENGPGTGHFDGSPNPGFGNPSRNASNLSSQNSGASAGNFSSSYYSSYSLNYWSSEPSIVVERPPAVLCQENGVSAQALEVAAVNNSRTKRSHIVLHSSLTSEKQGGSTPARETSADTKVSKFILAGKARSYDAKQTKSTSDRRSLVHGKFQRQNYGELTHKCEPDSVNLVEKVSHFHWVLQNYSFL